MADFTWPAACSVSSSGMFPRILGWLLIISCFAYLVASLTFIVLPSYLHLVTHLMQPLEAIGEGSMINWLLVKGVKAPPREALSGAS